MAASAKTDYSASVPDPSTLVGPGGVEHHIVRVRGLPWSCTENELIEFFEGVCIQSVHFTRDRDGRPSGDAYMVLASLKDQKLAHKFHKAHMGNRYLEVFEARYSEMSWMLTKNVDKNPKDGKMAEYEEFEPESDNIVKMRGLPFEAGPAEIVRFFEELPVAEKGILICKDRNSRPSGEGYCVFADEESAAEALKRDNASMGHRYIELFKATKEEALKAKRRSENPEEYEDTRYRALGYGGGGPNRSIGYGGGGPMRSGGGPGFGRGFARPNPYDRPSRGGGMPQGPYDMMPMSYSGGRGGGPMRGGGGGGRNMGYGYGPYAYGNNGGGFGGGRGGGNPPPLMGSGGGGTWSNNSSRGGEPPAPGDSSNPWSGAYDNDGFSNQRNSGEEQHIIKMRGVPFKATEMEISEWFSSCASCQEVNIMYGPDGRPSGTAEVTFQTEADAKAAMAKHRQNMGSRYIELFYEGGY